MNLYEQIIAIEPELQGRIILAAKEWNPNASFVNEKLIEGSWDNSNGIPLPTATQIVTAWGVIKGKEAIKNQARENYNQLVAQGFVSVPLQSLNGKTVRLEVTKQSALMFNLRVSQLREAISQGVLNMETDYTTLWDYDSKEITLSLVDFFSITLPFSQVVEQALKLERKI